MMTVMGLQRKSGTFEGKVYDNFIVSVAVTDVKNDYLIAGCDVKSFKIKSDDFITAFARNVGALNSPKVKEAKDIVGLLFVPAYSDFKGVTNDFTLAIPETSK